VENVLDPAHVNFAHHNVQGKREKAEPITFGVAETALEGFVVPGEGGKASSGCLHFEGVDWATSGWSRFEGAG
jgi:phenylpropionate dioxygenase-like ring-hydroxylating dioxygenase large terminal subunit